MTGCWHQLLLTLLILPMLHQRWVEQQSRVKAGRRLRRAALPYLRRRALTLQPCAPCMPTGGCQASWQAPQSVALPLAEHSSRRSLTHPILRRHTLRQLVQGQVALQKQQQQQEACLPPPPPASAQLAARSLLRSHSAPLAAM